MPLVDSGGIQNIYGLLKARKEPSKVDIIVNSLKDKTGLMEAGQTLASGLFLTQGELPHVRELYCDYSDFTIRSVNA